MRVALDTNVLIRLLIVDDERQALAARQVLQDADQLVLPTIVLCETAWVLKRTHRFAASELVIALRRLIDLQGVEVDRPAVEAGLNMLSQGGDFADGCILHAATRSGCDSVVTFDKTFAALSQGGASLLGA